MLCSSNTTSEKRSGWRVVKQLGNKRNFNLPKVLVTSIYGHDDMLEYLSEYRTQDKFKGKHYYVSGALCWFECNQYGEPTGSVYYVRRIPDPKLFDLPYRQRGFKRLKSQQKREISIKEKWLKERVDMTHWEYKKPRYKQ